MDTSEGAPFDPASLHKYLYVHANPVNHRDSSGKFLDGFGGFMISNGTLVGLQSASAFTAMKAFLFVSTALLVTYGIVTFMNNKQSSDSSNNGDNSSSDSGGSDSSGDSGVESGEPSPGDEPPSGEKPTTLQSADSNTISNRTANGLNEFFDRNLTRREWGRALEALKKDNGLANNFHGKIFSNGDFADAAGNVIANIEWYLP